MGIINRYGIVVEQPHVRIADEASKRMDRARITGFGDIIQNHLISPFLVRWALHSSTSS